MTPKDPNVLSMNIGLAPAAARHDVHVSEALAAERVALSLVAPETGQERQALLVQRPPDHPYQGPRMLVGANGQPISATPEAAPELVDVHGESLNSLTWPTYLAWRKTKTRPYDYVRGPEKATNVNRATPETLEEMVADYPSLDRSLEEIDQATLEMIGEVAELGELFHDNGASTFFGKLRDKLIDECGDILFCATWAFDAWGANPLALSDDLELIRVSDDNELPMFARVIASNDMGAVLGNARFVSVLGGMMLNFMLSAQTNAGLTANAFKKLKYQKRVQDVDVQVGRIANVLIVVNQILIVANSSVEEALKVNMRKLDARRPGGYDPSKPGGNRTGEGA